MFVIGLTGGIGTGKSTASIFFNEIGYKIFEFYGYENVNLLKEKFSTKGGLISWFGIVFLAGFTPLPFKLLTISSGFSEQFWRNLISTFSSKLEGLRTNSASSMRCISKIR